MTSATVYGSLSGRTRIATTMARPRSPTRSSKTCGVSSSIPVVTDARRASPGGLRLSDVDALEDPETRGHADERGATVGHERQRYPGDGHDTEDHTDVHDELEDDHRRHAGGEQRPERVARAPAGYEDAPDEQHEE